jgi:hypothetical protein
MVEKQCLSKYLGYLSWNQCSKICLVCFHFNFVLIITHKTGDKTVVLAVQPRENLQEELGFPDKADKLAQAGKL